MQMYEESFSCVCLSVQIENIDACLSFLAAKGVNIQGLSAEGKLGTGIGPFTGMSAGPESSSGSVSKQNRFCEKWSKFRICAYWQALARKLCINARHYT